MDILILLALLAVFAVFGRANFRYYKQKGNALVDEFIRFNKQ
ncbi:MAG: hypothetical protein U9Q61_10875 [Thermodesulfobacteriota bacterium]|nr:hypothetical protein [Thermodesulfobacteriota bacterium]